METEAKKTNGNGRGLNAVLDGDGRLQDPVVVAGKAIPRIIEILHGIPTQYHDAIIHSVKELLSISEDKEPEEKVGHFGF